MVDGVNLVINFGETSDSALLKYYDERVNIKSILIRDYY
jgi:hypothetical protein